jgi:XTP/dITP diphosphohydrolase
MADQPVWVLATGNPGKLAEFRDRLAPLDREIRPQSEWGVPEAEETGLSFVENALIKARNAAHHTGLPALADDSGLRVAALGGAPGVHSARYAGEAADDLDNNRKLLEEMAGVDDRRAAFHCVLVWLRCEDDPAPVIAQASWSGRILHQSRGTGGFGYDPLFLVDGEDKSSAELSAEHKNRISHRGQAIDRLLECLDELTVR